MTLSGADLIVPLPRSVRHAYVIPRGHNPCAQRTLRKLISTWVLVIGLAVPVSHAQEGQPDLSPRESKQIIEPELNRREVKVPNIDTEDFEIGIFTGWLSIEDFGADPLYGISAAYHLTEDLFFELDGGLSTAKDTNFRRIGLPVFRAEEENLYLVNFSVGAHLLPGEFFFGTRKSISSQFYVIGGTGITRFAGEDHFTFNYGVGFRMLPTDWFAIRIEFRDHVFDSDTLGTSKTTHNTDFHAGITVFY